MTARYTMDNTQGYTQAELNGLNCELGSWLRCEERRKGRDLTPDEANELIKRHNDDVAHR